MAEVVVGLAGLEKRLQAIGGTKAGKAIMTKLALTTVREAHILVPHKTGNLRRSIQVRSVTNTSAVIAAGAKYAAYVELGTKPHEITPHAKKALRWAAAAGGARLSGSPRTGAAVMFAKVVHHPGTRPKPYLVPAARKAISSAGLSQVVISEWNGAA